MKNNSLIVTIISQSACVGCHAKGACTIADYKDKEVEITDFNGNYKPGQEVTVLFKQSKGYAAVLWGYVFPFFLVLTTLIIALQLTADELKSGLLALMVLVPYYISLYFFRHLLKKVFNFEVEEID